MIILYFSSKNYSLFLIKWSSSLLIKLSPTPSHQIIILSFSSNGHPLCLLKRLSFLLLINDNPLFIIKWLSSLFIRWLFFLLLIKWASSTFSTISFPLWKYSDWGFYIINNVSGAPVYKKANTTVFSTCINYTVHARWMLLPGKSSCRTCHLEDLNKQLAELKEQPVTLYGGHFEREKPLQHRRPGWLPLHVLDFWSCPYGDKSA